MRDLRISDNGDEYRSLVGYYVVVSNGALVPETA